MLVNDIQNEDKKHKKVKQGVQHQKSFTDNNIVSKSYSIKKLNPQIEEKFKKLSNKLGLEKEDSNHRTTTNSSIGKMTKKSIERCFYLFEKGKIKNEVNKLIIQKNNELKEMQLLSKCTFKPATNTVKLIKNSQKDSTRTGNLYDRNEYWRKNKIDK